METNIDPAEEQLQNSRVVSDASSKAMSALHGNFIPLQSSEGLFLVPPPRRVRSPHRQRSHSPRRRQDPGVHLHLSLTDSQMDKLTSTLTRDKEADPTSDHRADAKQHEHSSLHAKAPSSVSAAGQGSTGFEHGLPADNGTTGSQSRSQSPDKRHNSPTKSVHCDSSSLHGLGLENMTFLATEKSPQQQNPTHRVSRSVRHRPGIVSRSSQSPSRSHRQRLGASEVTDTTSSVYSVDESTGGVAHVNPLHIQRPAEDKIAEQQVTILQDYTTWTAVSPVSVSSPSGRDSGSAPQTSDGKTPTESIPSGHDGLPSPGVAAAVQLPHYSPLQTYSNFVRPPRTGRKVMVGQNGWLERTGSTNNKQSVPARTPSKKGGFMDAVKRMAKEMAEATDKVGRRSKEGAADHVRRTSARMRTSLNPREQSLLYCELEFLLTSALDAYITNQFNAGRLDADKYKKVSDAWLRKGRPRVVGFRYDLETQLELVHLHADDFRFYGDRAGMPAAIAGVLEMMKVNARAIRIRTFCQPDPVIAKQLLDSQCLFFLVGSPEARQIQLAEVIQFFKIVLERESQAHPEDGTENRLHSTTAATTITTTVPGRSGLAGLAGEITYAR